MRFVAFPATEYDEVLSGYQPGQMVFSLLNHLTQLIAQENFITRSPSMFMNVIVLE
jgi:hypothetical protein